MDRETEKAIDDNQAARFNAALTEKVDALESKQDISNASLAQMADERDRLREALQTLLDEQDGPPLERRKEHWGKAMADSRALLAPREPEKE